MSTIKENTELLIQAAEQGNLDEVRRLIPISSPSDFNSQALWTAASLGNSACVELLLPYSSVNFSNALQVSVVEQHKHCFDLLLPHADYVTRTNTLETAALLGDADFVDALFDCSDHEAVLQNLRRERMEMYSRWCVLEHMQHQRQRERIVSAVDAVEHNAPKRKMLLRLGNGLVNLFVDLPFNHPLERAH